MRRTPAVAAVALVLATAAAAGAAPARGIAFTDPAGDANGLDGRTGTASQAAFDVTGVRITPYAVTRSTAGLAITVHLAAAPSTAPGSSYFFVAKQGECELTASRTATQDGVTHSTFVLCGPVVGHYSTYTSERGIMPRGRTMSFTVPADALPDARRGATLTGIEVGTAAGEPASGAASPARIDRAVYAKAYRVGS